MFEKGDTVEKSAEKFPVGVEKKNMTSVENLLKTLLVIWTRLTWSMSDTSQHCLSAFCCGLILFGQRTFDWVLYSACLGKPWQIAGTGHMPFMTPNSEQAELKDEMGVSAEGIIH